MVLSAASSHARSAATGQVRVPVATITDGAVFRAIDRHGRIATGLSDRAIALIVKRRVAAANIDPTGYSAHSLRAGCATEAAARGSRNATSAGIRATDRSRCCAAISAKARCS
jgi:hypothetical protein